MTQLASDRIEDTEAKLDELRDQAEALLQAHHAVLAEIQRIEDESAARGDVFVLDRFRHEKDPSGVYGEHVELASEIGYFTARHVAESEAAFLSAVEIDRQMRAHNAEVEDGDELSPDAFRAHLASQSETFVSYRIRRVTLESIDLEQHQGRDYGPHDPYATISYQAVRAAWGHDQSITYRELLGRSVAVGFGEGRVRDAIQALGLQQDSYGGICLRRG